MRARLGALVFLGTAVVGCFAFPSSDEFAAGTSIIEADSGAPGDAAADVAADGAPAPYVFSCPPGALVCADFEGAEVRGAFQSVVGTPTRVDQPVHSGSGALHASVVTGQDSSGVTTSFEGPPAKVTLDLWFQVTAPPTNESYKMRLTHLLFGPACDWDVSTEVWVGSDALYLGIDTYDKDRNPSCGPVRNNVFALLPASRLFQPVWHHLTISVDNTLAERKVRVKIDGEADTGTSIVSRRDARPSQLTFGVGVLCIQTDGGCFAYDSSGAYDVRVDDVSLVPSP